MSSNYACEYIYSYFVFTILCMKVRRRMMIPRNLDISGILEYYSLKIGISILLQTSKVNIKRSAERVTELSYLVGLQYFLT